MRIDGARRSGAGTRHGLKNREPDDGLSVFPTGYGEVGGECRCGKHQCVRFQHHGLRLAPRFNHIIINMAFRIALVMWLAATAIAQRITTHVDTRRPVEFKEEKVYGRDAYVLQNGYFRIAALRGGGHLAEIRLISGDPRVNINPMRVPHYPTIDPQTYDDSKHNSIYGADPHRWLSSGYMGHLLCFPFYGPPSAEEAQAGLGNHGEAAIVEWKKLAVERGEHAVTLRYGADLPKTQFRVERAITLGEGDRYARVEEWVENLVAWDRPINWMQHATFGPPFVEPGNSFLDVSAKRGLVGGGRSETASLRPNSEVNWPNGMSPDGSAADLRMFQKRAHAGTYVALLLDSGRANQFFALYHAGHRMAIAYVFPTAANYWIADWQENKSNRGLPWNGEVVARGIEFGSSPFAEGLKKSVERGSLYGAPAFRWIGGHQRLKTEFTVFVVETPADFNGVGDVLLENGAPAAIAR